MCVTKGRLDVAQICLGHMQNAHALATLRQLDPDSSANIKLATLAIHLGMLVRDTIRNICYKNRELVV